MASRPRRDAGPRQEQAASSHCPEAASVSPGCQEGGSLMGRGGPGAERCKSRGRAVPGCAAPRRAAILKRGGGCGGWEPRYDGGGGR